MDRVVFSPTYDSAMAIDRKVAPSISQRFYEYLNGLQEEFERRSSDTSTKGSSSRRFNIYLGNLKGEFELMSMEIETLREERNEYKEKGRDFIMGLLD